MAEMKKLDDLDLGKVSGGVNSASDTSWKWVTANVDKDYLALRSAPAYDSRNEISRLVSGTAFQILPDKKDGDYVYAYFNGDEGWVNSKYIKGFTMQPADSLQSHRMIGEGADCRPANQV